MARSRASASETPDQVSCYVRWLRLKASKEYQETSQEIRQLNQREHDSDERWRAARDTYRPYLESDAPGSPEKRVAQQKYWAAEDAATKAQCELTRKKDETCKQFGLFQWWDPDDASITLKNATALFDVHPSVEVLAPSPEKRRDWRTEVSRALDREGTWCEPPRWNSKVDKEGWITLKVNLNVPLEQSERVIGQLLRFYRDPLKTRRRPDKDAAALETWVCYEERKCFSAVARHLGRKVSTVKGQYVRACEFIYGQRPAGTIKQRRAGIVNDPAGEFQAHLGSCSRCQKATTADKFCSRWSVFVNQDTKASRERLHSN